MLVEQDIRFSYSAIAEPITTLFWGNKEFLNWARETGYNSAEYFPFRRTADEIVNLNIDVLASLKEIRSGHVRYNPYATFWSVVTKREDPLRPGTPLAFYNLAFASPKDSIRTLQKIDALKALRGEQFHVVTYPYEVTRTKPYGEYKHPALQIHPAVFNDQSNAEDIIRQVRSGNYIGVVWDTFHALEATASGNAPMGDWRYSLAKLLDAGVVVEVHVQAGRVNEKYSEVGDMDWLKKMTGFNPDYNNELAQMLQLIKQSDANIPLTIEVALGGLIKSELIRKPLFMHDALDKAQDIHRELIDYVKRV